MKSKIQLKCPTIKQIKDNSEYPHLWKSGYKIWMVSIDNSRVGYIYKSKFKTSNGWKKSYWFSLNLFEAYMADNTYIKGGPRTKRPKPYNQLGFKTLKAAKLGFIKALLLNLYKILS